MRRRAFYVLATLVAALTVLVAACHAHVGQAGHNAATSTETALISGEPVGNNANDTSFATTMLAYYAKSNLMASLVADRSAIPDLIAFAAKAGPSQQTNIQALKALLVQWNENADTTASSAPVPHIAGDIDDTTVAKLAAERGVTFDAAWLQSMIALDQGAIAVANTEAANGKNIDAIGLANQTVDVLTHEVDQLRQMQARCSAQAGC